MSDQLEPLSSDLRALLDREAEGYAEHARRSERALAAVELRVAMRDAAPARPARSTWSRRSSLLIAATVLLAVVGAQALIAHPEWIAPTVSAPAPLTPAPKPITAPPAPAPALEPALEPAPAPALEPAPPRDTLSAERALIDTARTALVRGRHADALSALARHQRRFPRGQLAEEREALFIQALELSGRSAEAEARRARFRAQFPDSLLR